MTKNIHRSIKPAQWRASALAVASCFALSAMPMAANAAGLGKVTVFSALGQPLRAEIELSATREELSGMKAQLAARDAFRQAGIDFSATLQGISLALDKRPNGQNVIRLSSTAPVNDPFVDMLVELNWPMGRLVREYTFLLDPPDIAAKRPLAAPVTSAAQVPAALTAAVMPEAASPAGTSDTIPSSIDEETRARARAADLNPVAVAEPPVAKIAESTREHTVKPGESLSKIAGAIKPEGVTLEQMLVGLLRANQDAFDGGNMNRLRAGKILTIPDASAMESVAPAEAKKVVMAQASDWNAYRAKLAAIAAKAPASENLAKQAATGKITAKVEDTPAPVAAPKDQVKVSKSDVGAASAGKPGKRSEEDKVIKEKELKDAAERAAALEKNVANLQKLLELKDQNLADMQQQAGAKSTTGESSAVSTPVKPAESTKVTEAPLPDAPVVSPAPAIPVPAQAPAEAAPLAKAEDAAQEKPAPATLPVAADTGVMARLLDNPLLPAGGASILALLAGFLLMRRRRSAKPSVSPEPLAAVLPEAKASPIENSVSIAPEEVPLPAPVSEAASVEPEAASVEPEEVDPVAEADVYMAYGRDAQAEEILLDALQKTPKRYLIHRKLLEIYANRKEVEQFAALAADLHGETGGVGPDWDQAAAMGLLLDPLNPLYGGAVPEAPLAPAVAADVAEAMAPVADVTLDSLPAAAEAPLEQALALAADSGEEAPVSTPVELADPEPDPVMAPAADALPDVSQETPEAESEPESDPAPLDFEFVIPAVEKAPAEAEAEAPPSALDFDLPDLNLAAEASPTETTPSNVLDFDLTLGRDLPRLDEDAGADIKTAKPADDEDQALDFDLSTLIPPSPAQDETDLDESDLDDPLLASAVEALPAAAPFDMKSITLDLDTDTDARVSAADASLSAAPLAFASTPSAPSEPVPEVSESPALDEAMAELDVEANEEAATKLDLAKAYEEMGDLEGARELLNEVVKEGDAAQREKARAILTKIDA